MNVGVWTGRTNVDEKNPWMDVHHRPSRVDIQDERGRTSTDVDIEHTIEMGRA